MASFVWISWIRFVDQHLSLKLAIITSLTRLGTSRQSLSFWRQRGYSQAQMLSNLKWLFDQIYEKAATTAPSGLFVGVRSNLNCNQLNCYARVAKKNTQICRLSVLDVVCAKSDYLGNVVIPNVAHRSNRCNLFAECYV